VNDEAQRALGLDTQNLDAMAAQLLVLAAFGRFLEADSALEHRLVRGFGRRAPLTSAGSCHVHARSIIANRMKDRK
jgi:hypothetical protein